MVNPYAPPQVSSSRPRIRYFPLLIRERRVLTSRLDAATFEQRLLAWGRRFGYQLHLRQAGRWSLRRSNRWIAALAWRIEKMPSQLTCHRDAEEGTIRLSLVCRYRWAVATPGDPGRLQRELDRLESQLG